MQVASISGPWSCVSIHPITAIFRRTPDRPTPVRLNSRLIGLQVGCRARNKHQWWQQSFINDQAWCQSTVNAILPATPDRPMYLKCSSISRHRYTYRNTWPPGPFPGMHFANMIGRLREAPIFFEHKQCLTRIKFSIWLPLHKVFSVSYKYTKLGIDFKQMPVRCIWSGNLSLQW